MKAARVFVFIDTRRKYFARYAGKTRTHAYLLENDAHVSSEMVEMFRISPETWAPYEPTEAA